ncbi:MAG: hypothetical protein OES69_11105 [Myxococcales bacterium]|nr:hypothetical protein [Myxococcales bacterium]MDH3844476.1 hypothetical protein [Myxococcales bacterium]
MRRLIPGIAILLAYSVTPGAGEITENVAHLLRDGHGAHVAHEASHAPEEDTHGCSGPFQTCPCHGTSAFLTAGAPFEIGVSQEALLAPSFTRDRRSDGVLISVFRPPIS